MHGHRFSRRALIQTSSALAAVLALAACGAPSNAAAGTASSAKAASAQAASGQTSAASSATAAGDTTATTAPVSTPTPSAATEVSTRTAPAATAPPATAVSAAPADTASSATTTLTLVSQGTQAAYQVQEQLAGHNLPSQAIGRTNAVTGVIVFDSHGAIIPAKSKITVDLRTLKSDQSMRDGYIQRDPLQTSRYPMATFVPTHVTGLGWPLPASGTATFTLIGTMTVHGTTQPITWTGKALFAPKLVTGTATTPFTFTQFGMNPPQTRIALSVENSGTLDLQFTATRTTA